MTACTGCHKVWPRPIMIVALTLAALTAVRAGGQTTFGDDTNTSANGWPGFFRLRARRRRFFGRRRQGDGGGQDGGAVVTTSNSIGVYKIPGFAKSINPDDIVISCSKDGYTQANVVRRPHAAGDITDPIEVECYLQKE